MVNKNIRKIFYFKQKNYHDYIQKKENDESFVFSSSQSNEMTCERFFDCCMNCETISGLIILIKAHKCLI